MRISLRSLSLLSNSEKEYLVYGKTLKVLDFILHNNIQNKLQIWHNKTSWNCLFRKQKLLEEFEMNNSVNISVH